jgi:hypothetical protein
MKYNLNPIHNQCSCYHPVSRCTTASGCGGSSLLFCVMQARGSAIFIALLSATLPHLIARCKKLP